MIRNECMEQKIQAGCFVNLTEKDEISVQSDEEIKKQSKSL